MPQSSVVTAHRVTLFLHIRHSFLHIRHSCWLFPARADATERGRHYDTIGSHIMPCFQVIYDCTLDEASFCEIKDRYHNRVDKVIPVLRRSPASFLEQPGGLQPAVHDSHSASSTGPVVVLAVLAAGSTWMPPCLCCYSRHSLLCSDWMPRRGHPFPSPLPKADLASLVQVPASAVQGEYRCVYDNTTSSPADDPMVGIG